MYVFDKPEPVRLSVLPIIPYPKFLLIILNFLKSSLIMLILFFKTLVRHPTDTV